MFWDSSALVPLLVPEPQSAALATLVTEDKEATIWWGTPLECHSALHRRNREHPIPAAVMTTAIERIRTVVEHADTVSPSDELRRRAARLLAVHPLRPPTRFSWRQRCCGAKSSRTPRVSSRLMSGCARPRSRRGLSVLPA